MALDYLIKRGLRPVVRNFRTRRGEIDLVMLDVHCLVFVEVRFRSASSLVDARLTVDSRKQSKLACAAAMFLAKHPQFANSTCRFDILAIDKLDATDTRIEWLRNAFRPDG